MYDFSKFESKVSDTEEWLKREYSAIRTGRATPALLDSIDIDSYGSKSKISHVASVNIEDPRTLRITPWDRDSIVSIESAINNSNLGVSVAVDESGLRVSFPELTSERREMLQKLVREKHEEARISIKKEREEVWNDIVKQEKDGDLTEDDKFRFKDDLQKKVDDANKLLDELTKKKETELSE